MALIDFSGIANELVYQTIQGFITAVLVLLFLALGYIVAHVVTALVRRFLEEIHIEKTIKSKGLDNALMGFTLTQVITVLLNVYIIFVFLGAAASLIQVGFLTDVVADVLDYIPSLVQGLVIIVATLFVAAYIGNTIKREQKVVLARQISLGIKVFLAYIAVLLALPLILPGLGSKLRILESILELFISSLVIAVGLGVGLAIGLGLKDPISAAAGKHQALFDDLFGKIEKKK